MRLGRGEKMKGDANHTPPPPHGPNVLSLIGYVLGGLSLLDLAETLSPVELYGKLKTWFEAFERFVTLVRDVFFGWLEIYWFSVSPEEMSVIILALTLTFAVARASPASNAGSERRYWSLWREGLLAGLVLIFCPVVLIALVMPDVLGLALSLVWLGYFYWDCLMNNPGDNTGDWQIQSRFVRMELLGILAVFFLLILLNYLYFAD